MLKKLKQSIALFSLLVFLFPLVVKQWHSYQHDDEQHSNQQKGYSDYKSTHHCSICDYIPAVADVLHERVILSFNLTHLVSFQHIFPIYQCFAKSNIAYSYALRGPPFIF